MPASRHPLTIVVPSRKPWPSPESAVTTALAAAAEVGGEVILATGHPSGAPLQPVAGLRIVTSEVADVFSARSAALAAADGEIVAVLEDHCFPPPGWATTLLQEWQHRPDADGLVGVIGNGAPDLIDRASFLVTWAPFIGPMAEVPLDRCPAPGVVSYRRAVIEAAGPALTQDGWMEYDLPIRLRAEGRLAAADTVRMVHTQHLRFSAFVLQYWSGRSFTGLRRDADGSNWHRLRRAWTIPGIIRRQTRAALAANAGIRSDRATLAVVGMLAWCNGIGQIVGVITGSPGAALSKLE